VGDRQVFRTQAPTWQWPWPIWIDY
jgi:hypothetical protein